MTQFESFKKNPKYVQNPASNPDADSAELKATRQANLVLDTIVVQCSKAQ